MTDDWLGYNSLYKYKNYLNSCIKHSQREYVKGGSHTNNIEDAWSILKRSIIGIYHLVTRKHLHKYVNEFVFRYNTKWYSEKWLI